MFLAETIVADIDPLGADGVFDMRDIFLRKGKLCQLYATSNKSVTLVSTYIKLQDDRILSNCVFVPAPLSLRKTVRVFEFICLVVLVLETCESLCIKKAAGCISLSDRKMAMRVLTLGSYEP